MSVQVDAIIVATRADQVANKTPSPLAVFGRRVLHSSEYSDGFRRDVAERKLRVLAVGGGESGADIQQNSEGFRPNVTVWLRQPSCVGPRYLNVISEMQQVAANKMYDSPTN